MIDSMYEMEPYMMSYIKYGIFMAPIKRGRMGFDFKEYDRIHIMSIDRYSIVFATLDRFGRHTMRGEIRFSPLRIWLVESMFGDTIYDGRPYGMLAYDDFVDQLYDRWHGDGRRGGCYRETGLIRIPENLEIANG